MSFNSHGHTLTLNKKHKILGKKRENLEVQLRKHRTTRHVVVDSYQALNELIRTQKNFWIPPFFQLVILLFQAIINETKPRKKSVQEKKMEINKKEKQIT